MLLQIPTLPIVAVLLKYLGRMSLGVWCMLRYNEQLEQYRAATKLLGPQVGLIWGRLIASLLAMPSPVIVGEYWKNTPLLVRAGNLSHSQLAGFPTKKMIDINEGKKQLSVPFRMFAQVFSKRQKLIIQKKRIYTVWHIVNRYTPRHQQKTHLPHLN